MNLSLKNNQQCICQVLWTWSHSHHTSLWKSWHPLADHHEHHQHISYHWHCTTWSEDSRRQTSVEKAITWQKSFEKLPSHLTFHFCRNKLEKVVLHKLLSHLQENNLSNPFQSAYRAGHTTETVLLRIVNDILSALDNDNISFLFLLDLSAAFDTVDHQILLCRLNSVFGIQSTALQWFQSYLSDRYQSTSVNNSSSSPSQLMYGVPQVPILGPILFVLYTTPLSDIIANHTVNHQLFADDTQIQESAPLSEVTTLTKELNACTDDIKTWMTENQLKLNDKKKKKKKKKFFSFPFRPPWNLLPLLPPPPPPPTRLLLAFTTSPSLILPGTLDSFLTKNCPWRSTS